MFVSWFSYRCCFFSYMRLPYSLIHVVSSDAEKERRTAIAVAVAIRFEMLHFDAELGRTHN